MKKIAIFVLLAVTMMPLAASQAFATEETAQTVGVEVGNKICPVMGGEVDGEHFVVYQGKRYALCCAGCEKMFLGDPEKYAATAQAEGK